MFLDEIKRLPMTSKEYSNSTIKGNPIQNFSEYDEYQRPTMRDPANNNKFLILYGDNRINFKKVLGKPEFHWRGEYYFHGWLIEYKNAKLILMTAKEYGTCYEVVVKNHDKKEEVVIKDCIELIDNLVNEILKLGD